MDNETVVDLVYSLKHPYDRKEGKAKIEKHYFCLELNYYRECCFSENVSRILDSINFYLHRCAMFWIYITESPVI